jgi:predicted cupin superfamily sugar epimerase
LKTSEYWIKKLRLEKHPEGGWFKEVYRSAEMISEKCLPEGFSGSRNASTSIYYLLEDDNFSSFHRIKSDEIWHYYTGNSSLEIISIEKGEIKKQILGNQAEENQLFQVVVPKNTWFAARLTDTKGYALAGCTVSPGFNFDDFELAGIEFLAEYPQLKDKIAGLIRV